MVAQQIAIYGMIGIGILIGLAVVFGMWKSITAAAPKGKPVTMGILSFALLGVGAYGPSFLDTYSRFLKVLPNLDGVELEAAYEKAVEDIGKGKVSEEARRLIQAYMLQHPTKNLDTVLERGIEKAKPEERVTLERIRIDLKRRQDTAILAATATLAPQPAGTAIASKPQLQALDNASIRILSKRPAEELRMMRIDPSALGEVASARAAAGDTHL